jgi:hypothetical protein
LLLAGLIVAHPVLNTGFSDDFSYIYTAKRAAETGRIIYNGFACPLLGIMVYVAAAIIKVFGFSFTKTRMAVMLFALVNAAVVHRLLLRVAANNFNAVVATCAVVFGPMAFFNSTVFFTDLPAVLAISVTLYCCVRAVEAGDARTTIQWLIWGTVGNLVLGSVRQTAWMGALAMVPATGWMLRGRRGVLTGTAVLWTVSAVVVLGGAYWLAHQPYAPQESLLVVENFQQVLRLSVTIATLVLDALPLLLAFFAVKEFRRGRGIWLASAACVVVICAEFHHLKAEVLAEAAFAFSFGSTLPSWPPFVLGLEIFALAMACGVFFLCLPKFRAVGESSLPGISSRTLVRICLPYAAVCFLLVASRLTVWPRYALSFVPLGAVLLYRLYAETTDGKRMPLWTSAVVGLYVVLAVVETHDAFVAQNAPLALEQWYVAQGLPRERLESNMQMDGWYEVSTGHNVNEFRIRVPANAYHERLLPHDVLLCHTFSLQIFPEIHPVYRIVQAADPRCDDGPPLQTAVAHKWIGPDTRFLLYKLRPDQQIP